MCRQERWKAEPSRLVLVLFAGALGCGASTPPVRPAQSEPDAARAAVAPTLLADVSFSPPAAGPPDGVSRPELVLQGGHVLWIHSAALHPNGHAVALLSLDMPDLGQVMVSPVPLSTVTLIDTRDFSTRASYRIPSTDLQGRGDVCFSADGRRLSLEGSTVRSWDLRTGQVRHRSIDRAWAVPDPSGELVALAESTGLSLADLRTGEILWTREMDLGEGPYDLSIPAWHPSGDSLALSADSTLLVSRAGEVMVHVPFRALSLFFSSTGRALYLWNQGRGYQVRHPRTLEVLAGESPWYSIQADARDGLLVATTEESGFHEVGGLGLYAVGSGELVANLEVPEPFSGEIDASWPVFAFVPGGPGLWACRIQQMAAETAAQHGLEALGQPVVSQSQRPEEEWVAVLQCWKWDEEGNRQQDLSVLLPYYPRGAGPLSFTEVGPLLVVTSDERLVVAYGRYVYVVDGSGRLLHSFGDVGVEAVVDSVTEAPDGRGVALSSAIALGWFGADAPPQAAKCPGLLASERRVRFVGGQPRLYSERFECQAGVAPGMHDAILGVSADGASLLVARGDDLVTGGSAALLNGDEEHEVEGVRTWCQRDGCGPDGEFSPDGRYLAIDGGLYDVRSGRRLRELEGGTAGFSPRGRYSWAAVEEGAGVIAEGIRVEEVRSGRQVFVGEMLSLNGDVSRALRPTVWRWSQGDLGDQDERWQRYPRALFSRDERWLVVARPGPADVLLSAIDLRGRRFTWQHRIPGTFQGLALRGARAVLVTSVEGQSSLQQVELRRGAVPGEPVSLGPGPMLSEDGERVAWCDDAGQLTGLEVGTGARRGLGLCAGTLLLVGRRFVATADGALVRVTRWEDGESLRLRVALRVAQDAWAIAEDDQGRWLAEPGAAELYRYRAAGPIWEAAMVPLAGAPGRDPELLQRFFGAAGRTASE